MRKPKYYMSEKEFEKNLKHMAEWTAKQNKVEKITSLKPVAKKYDFEDEECIAYQGTDIIPITAEGLKNVFLEIQKRDIEKNNISQKKGKHSAETRLIKSETHRKYYLDLWRKTKTDNPKTSTRKINDMFCEWLGVWNNSELVKNPEIKKDKKFPYAYSRNTLLNWRKKAGQ